MLKQSFRTNDFVILKYGSQHLGSVIKQETNEKNSQLLIFVNITKEIVLKCITVSNT